MKKLIVPIIALTLFFACKPSSNQGTGATADHKKLYEKSVAMKDYQTAITAIQMVLLSDSTNGLRDSLPELFGAVNNVQACLSAVTESLKRYPNDEKFQNIKLICLQETGEVDEQFAILTNLYKSTGKVQYIAQIASLQVGTGNLAEARKTIDNILANYKGSKEILEVFADERTKQQVPVEAAAWNMLGFVYMQQKNLEKAKECYFKALEIYPDFAMPKRNLDLIFSRK
jgi:tetratricopeptide (TPR) repeat protein